MQYVKDIKSVHIELTDKCQAQCPMCPRNYHGGKVRPFIRNGDISIEQFKEWFPKDFLVQLNNFYSCGNYGDPAFARDCLEIYSYIRECNPKVRLALHTNGGMRNDIWWKKLANVMGTETNTEVIFTVDGFKGKHELYRKNTNFDKVIENIKAYISGGGIARVDSLVFEHNESDVDELESYLLDIGVRSVNFVSTTRFYEMTEFPVQNENGDFLYNIKPPQTSRFKRIPNNTLDKLVDKQVRDAVLKSAIITPDCEKEQAIYVDPYGNILPCCYIGSDYLEEPIEETKPIHILRNISVENSKQIMEQVGVPKCQDGVLGMKDKLLFEKMNNFWTGENKCMTCVKACSKVLYNDRKTNA